MPPVAGLISNFYLSRTLVRMDGDKPRKITPYLAVTTNTPPTVISHGGE